MKPAAHIASTLTIICAAVASSSVLAQAYPTKPIKLLMPLPPASLIDIVGRGLAEALSPVMGRPIIPENRAGANGTIGMAECARSPSDGYTICVTDGNILTINHYAYANLPYDPASFVPVAHLADLEVAFVVQSRLPVKTMKEFIEYARARPGQITWGSWGAGSTPHVYVEWFQAKTGVKFNHVPYKSPAQVQIAMLAGEVDASNMGASFLKVNLPAGKVRLIAVSAGKRRSEIIGNTPTFKDQGYDIDFRNWLAIVFPGGTSTALARRWNVEINKLLEDPKWVARVMTASALIPTGGTPEDLAAVLQEKRKLGAELAKIANLVYK